MTDLFLNWQLKVMFVLGLVCLAVIFIFDFRGLPAVFTFVFSLIFAFCGQKLFAAETSENWLKFSYSDIIKNILGGVFLLLGWTVFLRGVFALSIAALLLQSSK
jgi:hypothetical protein